jgi:hypothetical protein
MPFTLAHPAAAVPLARPLGRLGVLPALVIGAIVPDVAYLWRGIDSHSVAGLFLFCVPAGLLLYAGFRLLLERPLRSLLPDRIRARLAAVPPDRRPRPVAAAVASVFAGALTHIGWDSFTHQGTMALAAMPWLSTHLFTVAGLPVALHRLLQHLSTAAGFALLGYWLVRWYRRTPPARLAPDSAPPAAQRALLVTILILVPSLHACFEGIRAIEGPGVVAALRAFGFAATMHGGEGLGITLLVFGAIWHLHARLRSAR